MSAQAATAPAYPGRLILEQIASVMPGSYTANVRDDMALWINNIQVLAATGDCLVHRQENPITPIRSYHSCTNTFEEWILDQSSVGQVRTTQTKEENMSVGMTDYTRFTNIDQLDTPLSEASLYLSDALAFAPFLGQWLRFDGTTGKQANIYGANSSEERFRNRAYMFLQSEEPFGWTQESENTWTTPNVFLLDAWSPLGMLVNLQAISFGDAMVERIQSIFMTSAGPYTGRYVVRGDLSGDIHIEGAKEGYSKLTVDLSYDPGTVSMVWEATPVQGSEHPYFRQTVVFSGHDMDLTQETAHTPGASESPFVVKIHLRRTVTNMRPLEMTVQAPLTSLHGGEALVPEEYSCSVLQYNDVCHHWSAKWILRAMANKHIGYIGTSQYGDNPPKALRPDHAIQRSEFARLIVHSHSMHGMHNNYRLSNPEWDTDLYVPADADPKAWYIDSVKGVLMNGVAVLQEGRTFRPNETLNRAETMTFLARIIDGNLGGGYVQGYFTSWRDRNPQAANVYFPDVSVNAWYAPYVALMADVGILDTSQARFRPGDAVTRAEAITLLERLREKLPQLLSQ